MDIENHQVEELLFEVIGEVNEQLPEDQRIEKKKSTLLFGEDGVLDSLGLVNLIISIEQKIQDELGSTVVLVDEAAMSQTSSPFRSVDVLIDYIAGLLKGDSDD